MQESKQLILHPLLLANIHGFLLKSCSKKSSLPLRRSWISEKEQKTSLKSPCGIFALSMFWCKDRKWLLNTIVLYKCKTSNWVFSTQEVIKSLSFLSNMSQNMGSNQFGKHFCKFRIVRILINQSKRLIFLCCSRIQLRGFRCRLCWEKNNPVLMENFFFEKPGKSISIALTWYFSLSKFQRRDQKNWYSTPTKHYKCYVSDWNHFRKNQYSTCSNRVNFDQIWSRNNFKTLFGTFEESGFWRINQDPWLFFFVLL